MQVFVQVLLFLVANRALVMDAIRGVEELIPDAPGNEKCAAVKGMIAASIGIEEKIETAWPKIQPIFNLLVAQVKSK